MWSLVVYLNVALSTTYLLYLIFHDVLALLVAVDIFIKDTCAIYLLKLSSNQKLVAIRLVKHVTNVNNKTITS